MSGQFIELLIFAGIAFFIINKLIATLGSTNEDDLSRGKSISKKMRSMKNVTDSAKQSATILKPKFSKAKKFNLKDIVLAGTETEVAEALEQVTKKLPSFSPSMFLKGAKAAFKMIIDAGANHDESELEELVDKRYIENFSDMSDSYGEFSATNSALKAHISEIYMFGNNIFVKVLFAGKGITSKISDMHEEWTFTKSLLDSRPAWHLTNIDRPH